MLFTLVQNCRAAIQGERKKTNDCGKLYYIQHMLSQNIWGIKLYHDI